jgi:hypothetical protein
MPTYTNKKRGDPIKQSRDNEKNKKKTREKQKGNSKEVKRIIIVECTFPYYNWT